MSEAPILVTFTAQTKQAIRAFEEFGQSLRRALEPMMRWAEIQAPGMRVYERRRDRALRRSQRNTQRRRGHGRR